MFGLPVQTAVSMWYGNKELTIDKTDLTLPGGVAGTADKGNISITGISKAASNNLNIGITAYATYAGVQYHKQLSFVINKIIPGENGKNPVIYELMPSVSSIKVDKAGNYDVTMISCGLNKIDGLSFSTCSTLPEGYTMKYVIDEDTPTDYPFGVSVSVSGIRKKIKFQLLNGATVIDMETIFLIVDGNDGQDGQDGKDGLSAIFADLDNAVTSVACNPAGEVLFGLPASTGVSMWYGTEKLSLDEITVAAPNGVAYTIEANGVKVTSIAASVSDVINMTITAKDT